MDKNNKTAMKDVEFMTAAEKEKVLRQWKTFLKHGLQFKGFTKALYNHLIQHCSFIAHYNRQGFYATYFESPDDTIRFFQQFDRDSGCISVEYGGTWWLSSDYQDINAAMCDVFDECKKLFYEQLTNAARERAVSQARALLLEHDVPVNF